MEFCHHIKVDGRPCDSPALQGDYFCYFPSRLHKRHAKLRKTAAIATKSTEKGEKSAENASAPELHLPTIEDVNSLHVALTLVTQALALGRIEPPRARVLLYSLQLISANIGRTHFSPGKIVLDVVRTKSGVDLTP